MQTLDHWAYNGDRLWTSRDGQHTDHGRVIEAPPHPKPGDVVRTDRGAYRLGTPLMDESSPLSWGAVILIAVMIAIGLGIKHLTT